MNAVTLKEAKLSLEQLVEQVLADAAPTIILSESGAKIVLMPLDDYNSWRIRLGTDPTEPGT